MRTTACAGIGSPPSPPPRCNSGTPSMSRVADLAAHTAAVAIVCTAIVTTARRTFPGVERGL